MAAGTPSLMQEFIDAGQVVNLTDDARRARRGGRDPAGGAVDYRGAVRRRRSLYALPTELNIEGFWYNKQILADNGIEAPTTWDDLVDAAATLKSAGVQPFSAAGKDGWPVTRLVGNYIFRDLGPDALQKVADGDAKLTDPEYVAAADAVAELGSRGLLRRRASGSIDYNAAMNQFLTGDAAFFYMGSWALGELQRPRAEQDRRRQHRVRAVPGRRGRRGQHRPGPRQRRHPGDAVREGRTTTTRRRG